VQMGGWFNKEIRTIDDFRGLKMRMPGLAGEVLSKLGAIITNIPATKILDALQSGAIDATEWVSPFEDLQLGLHKAAKYYY
ncbi:ABC transporter substrate-binding protein, partial [Thermodesulfobacteriota bacterium]